MGLRAMLRSAVGTDWPAVRWVAPARIGVVTVVVMTVALVVSDAGDAIPVALGLIFAGIADPRGILRRVDALVVDGIEVAVRRSARARRVRLVANPGAGVELVLPARGGDDAARELVRTHRAWIAEQHARLERRVLGLDRPGVV
ncbi:MAG: hypothetical protein ACKOSO_05195 [Actinomycetota bacterium]